MVDVADGGLGVAEPGVIAQMLVAIGVDGRRLSGAHLEVELPANLETIQKTNPNVLPDANSREKSYFVVESVLTNR
jgi:hypothetical protein